MAHLTNHTLAHTTAVSELTTSLDHMVAKHHNPRTTTAMTTAPSHDFFPTDAQTKNWRATTQEPRDSRSRRHEEQLGSKQRCAVENIGCDQMLTTSAAWTTQRMNHLDCEVLVCITRRTRTPLMVRTWVRMTSTLAQRTRGTCWSATILKVQTPLVLRTSADQGIMFGSASDIVPDVQIFHSSNTSLVTKCSGDIGICVQDSWQKTHPAELKIVLRQFTRSYS